MRTLSLTLYVDGYFTNVWDASCYVALIEKGLEFSTARALLVQNQGVPAALLERTGIARIPALAHGDFWLTESMAIIEYLEEMFPDPALLPRDVQARARTRQIMTWLRADLRTMREERPWQVTVYPTMVGPLSRQGEREARELVDLVVRLSARGELDDWTIAHVDLALMLMRLAYSDYPLPPEATALVERERQRPSLRAYLEHARPPHPPPSPRS